jgi:hypothetical protein
VEVFRFDVACFPFVDVFFLAAVVFFVVFEWLLFFVCAVTRLFGTTIVPISKHPTSTVIEILAQLCNIVSLFFPPTYLLYAARACKSAILILTESEQIRFTLNN